MNIFGIDITKAKKGGSSSGGHLIRESMPQGPYSNLFKDYIARKVQPDLYEALRESIPVLDTAIIKLKTLDGILRIDGENQGLVNEIEDWMGDIQVNDMEAGLQAFVNNQGGETYEQGFSICEFTPNRDRTDIVRLDVADSKNIRFKRNGDDFEIWYKGLTDNTDKPRSASELVGDILRGTGPINFSNMGALTSQGWSKLNKGNILYHSIDNENSNPYGTSMMRSTEFSAKILLTIQNATYNSWERFGEPSYHVNYKAGKSKLTQTALDARRDIIAEDFQKVLAAKRAGMSADFNTAVDSESDITIEIIGANGQILEIEMPARHVLEQIIARTGLTAWILGMHWSTTERLAKYEVEMMLQDAETRAKLRRPGLKRLIETLLRMRGRTWKRDDWFIDFDRPNLHDLVAQAQARFLNAQADMYDRDNGAGQSGGGTQEPKAVTVKIDKINLLDEESINKIKERISKRVADHDVDFVCEKESRPVPHPELDAVEDEFLGRLKSSWRDLEARVLTILKRTFPEKGVKAPGDDPPDDIFKLTDEQKAEIEKAKKDYIDEWDPQKDPEKGMEFYYGEAYSLGSIQVAHMTGAERPLLNIIQNSETHKALVDVGFKLLKNDVTRIFLKQVMPEMEAQMLTGTNPRHVAYVLSGKFGDANSNWERLVRSEMTMAAERGKIDEAKAEGVEKMEFVAAPDACPICVAVAGVYDMDEVPLPVEDTHPRCYCTLTTVIE